MQITDLKKGMKIIGIIQNTTYYVRKVERHRVYINLYRSTFGWYITNEDINWIATVKINDFKENINMKPIKVKVKIIKVSDFSLYKIGNIFEVIDYDETRYIHKSDNIEILILKVNCEIISDESEAITLLQSLGYKIELPYIEPTDSEIYDRIRNMNKEIGYVADWSNDNIKYHIYYSYIERQYSYDSRQVSKTLGTTYTTQSIANQITTELNTKTFIRV